MIIDPKNATAGEFQAILQGAVAPRPIAFASTIDTDGQVNLSPFSYFNVFSANPPILVFSPARRVRDNTNKHTLENVEAVKEVVINIVDFSMVEQMSLSSTEYDKGVNEFQKSGLTEESSQLVTPPRVKEAPVAFECKVIDIISLGDQGGAGNLVICEVLLARVKEEILDANGSIDPFKLDAVSRMGGNWYCRANGSALFEILKPLRTKGIGVDQIPEVIKNSHVLTGNNLGRLGNVEALPSKFDILNYGDRPEITEMKVRFQNDPESLQYYLHEHAKELLNQGLVMEAWMVLLQS
ncbi:flavin reductase family protein [Belliella sp. DSM 111904]|uniref:Flavin reductase family protein n=1 Tax=Belliella filtrata TaxID=2923435 RepID=A0ABS9UZ24_9BACT|nr:flavin reductase family protein [Belliella filtrata]MCH7409200.1 flavin reductase family protein [Belliella filtrata]